MPIKFMGLAGWSSDLKTIEEIKKQMVLGATSVEEHRQAPTAQAVTEFRQTLLTDVKAISANGSAELIVAMEKALAQHDLEYYANSKTMTGSLKTTLSEFAMIERQLDKVDDSAKYKATDQSFGLAKNRSKGLPLDEARQAFKSHYARLVNLDKAPLDDLQKKLIEARRSGFHRAQQLYIARQARTLGVEPAAHK